LLRLIRVSAKQNFSRIAIGIQRMIVAARIFSKRRHLKEMAGIENRVHSALTGAAIEQESM